MIPVATLDSDKKSDHNPYHHTFIIKTIQDRKNAIADLVFGYSYKEKVWGGGDYSDSDKTFLQEVVYPYKKENNCSLKKAIMDNIHKARRKKITTDDSVFDRVQRLHQKINKELKQSKSSNSLYELFFEDKTIEDSFSINEEIYFLRHWLETYKYDLIDYFFQQLVTSTQDEEIAKLRALKENDRGQPQPNKDKP